MEIKEITPKHLKCGVGLCPAVYESNDNYIIIGRCLSENQARALGISNRIGKNEKAIIINKSFFGDIANERT